MAKKTKTKAVSPRPKTEPSVELMSADAAAELLNTASTLGVWLGGDDSEELVSLELAAEILGGVPMGVVENLILDGVLEAVPLGQRRLVFKSDVTDFVRGSL